MNSRLPHFTTRSKVALSTVLGGIVLGSALIVPDVLAQQALPLPTSTQPAQETTAQSLPTQQVSQTTIGNESISLSAIPPRIGDDGSLTAAPGEVLQVQLRIRNETQQTTSITSDAFDFVIGEDGETPVQITDTDLSNRWSLASWLTVSPEQQTLGPGQTGVLNAVIQIPEDALPGGHYAMVTHQPATGDGPSETASAVTQQVGSLLYVTVEGPINEEAFIRNLVVPSFTEYGPVPITFSVDNRSDIHIRPRTNVEIYNIFGRKVDSITVEPKNVFPLAGRDFETEWSRTWGMGLYTAKVVMSFGSGQVAVAATQFWLVPLTLVLTVLSIVLIVVVAAVAIRRHYLHRKTDRQHDVEALQKRISELENGTQEPPSRV